METAVYATCILSVVVAIFQFVSATDSRSVRWVRLDRATGTGCFALR